MSLSEDVDLEEFIMAKDEMSGADIKAVCTEAGLLALRERRMRVTKTDFTAAREKVCLYIGPKLMDTDLFDRFFTGRMRVRLRGCTCDTLTSMSVGTSFGLLKSWR
jgi:AAA+ lid domain